MRIYLNTFSLLALTGLSFSCNQDFESKDIRKEINFESEGINVKFSANYLKEFKADIAIGSPHAPIVIPYAGYKKNFFITIQPDNREPFFVEPNSNEISIKGDELVEESINNINLTFSPNKDHLLYKGKIQQKDTIILIHYLNKKFPFTSSYFQNSIDIKRPDFKSIPEVMAIAARIIKDTTKIYLYENILCAIPDEYMFWEALKKLPPENGMDYIVLDQFETKPFTMYHIEYLCSDWHHRSGKWKNAVSEKFNSIYKKITQTENNLQFSYTDHYNFDHSIEIILDSRRDKKMKDDYLYFLINNFEKGFVSALGSIIQEKNPENIGFFKKHQDILISHCNMVLEKNNPDQISDMIFIADLLKNKLIYNKAVEKAVQLWPAYPLNQNIDTYGLSPQQRKRLVKRAITLIGTKYSYDACDLLNKFADCDLLQKLKKQYPTEIQLRYDCE